MNAMEFILGLVICAIIGALILQPFKKQLEGAALGGLLGPIGLVIAAVYRANLRRAEQLESVSREARACPFCAELILRHAKICKHCGRDVEPLPVDLDAARREMFGEIK